MTAIRFSVNSGIGESNDPSIANDDEIVQENINNNASCVNDRSVLQGGNNDLVGYPTNDKPTWNKIKNKKKVGNVLAKKSKHDVLKIHMKANSFTHANEITKKKSNQSSTHVANNAATKRNEHKGHETLSSPPHPIKRRHSFQVKKKQTHDHHDRVSSPWQSWFVVPKE